jgi:hypothetical protein
MIQKMLANFGWKRRYVYGETRVVERFLWWPRTLKESAAGTAMETRCWCRAKIVQVCRYWDLPDDFSGGWYDSHWAGDGVWLYRHEEKDGTTEALDQAKAFEVHIAKPARASTDAQD